MLSYYGVLSGAITKINSKFNGAHRTWRCTNDGLLWLDPSPFPLRRCNFAQPQSTSVELEVLEVLRVVEVLRVNVAVVELEVCVIDKLVVVPQPATVGTLSSPVLPQSTPCMRVLKSYRIYLKFLY